MPRINTYGIATLLLSLSLTGTSSAEMPSQEQLINPFFAKHCTGCHGADAQEGGFRVDTLAIELNSPRTMARWEEIMNRVNSGDMPPQDEEQPPPEEVSRVSDWITHQLRESEAARQSSAGERVAFRKLSRSEYAQTVRDLLGVDYDVEAPTGLPEDPDWNGFERIGSVLTLSASHVEKYLSAAEAVLDEALSLRPEPKREKTVWTPFFMRHRSFEKEFQARGMADKVRIEIVPNNYTTDTWNLKIPTTGEYRLRIKLSGLRPQDGRAPRLKVYIPSINKTLFERDIDAPEDKPIVVESRFHLTEGSYPVRLINSVPGPNPEARRSRHSPTQTAFTTTRSRVPWQLKLTDDEFKPIEPTLIIDEVEWDGPIVDSWPTAAHRSIYFGGEEAKKDDAYAREIVSRFAERAWRRPATPAEVDRLLQPYQQSKSLGDDFEHSVKSSLLAVLCSKSFLYLVEGKPKKAEATLDDWELASRLSYFLWSSMPDAELLELAKSGKLHNPEVLRQQVRRMLADPKSQQFAESFPRQWLQLRKVGMFPPDKLLYPEYDENLEQSMVAETVSYFGEVLRNKGNLREFLDSDWTMLNERLATHYEIAGIRGDEMRRVALKPEDHRGGLLTQAAVLSLSSDGTRHRPVHRGVWVLESILGNPPPPPPANVPPLGTPEANAKKMTVREKLELHRSDANCAACHRKIDPLGLAFDNYDAIGRFRLVETIKEGKGANPPLDSSGQLPDGRTFADAAELKKLLRQDEDKFASAFAEKLATYALRRSMTFTDREDIKVVVAKAKKDNYTLTTVIEELVASPLFLKR